MARLPIKLLPTLGGLFARISLLGLAVSLAPSLGHLHWLINLIAHFQIQAAFSLTILLTATLILKQWKAGAFVAAILFISLLRLSPFVIPSKSAPASGKLLSVTTLNVLTSNEEKARVADFLQSTSSDVLIICETDPGWTKHLVGALPDYPHHHKHIRSDNFGLLILSKWPLSITTTHAPSPWGVPLMEAVADTPIGKIRFFGAHPIPPMGSEEIQDHAIYLSEMAKLARESDLPVVVAGDLNATPWGIAHKNLLKGGQLQDLSRGQGLNPTWKPFKSSIFGLSLDHILVSHDLVGVGYEIGPELGSDHYPVSAVLKRAGK